MDEAVLLRLIMMVAAMLARLTRLARAIGVEEDRIDAAIEQAEDQSNDIDEEWDQVFDPDNGDGD